MAAARFCPQCGTALIEPSSGVCPRCAFELALIGGRPGSDYTTYAGGTRSDGPFVPPKPDQLAQHFPQLEILDLIGQGGMGAVYKARQRGLDRLVALKILPPHLARDAAFEERFHREARALARLSHPNIVSVYDSGQAGGLYYFIMEYVDGVNLRQALQAGQLSAKEALAIVPQVCDALQYAHDEGIVHRDIKPENVLVDTKGRVHIADFGLARLLRKTDDNFTLTGAQQVMGTPRYMAPEQLEGTHDVDHRADIYSLGVVFYEMLTGELPLGRFAPPSKKVQVDVRLDEVVLRTLEKEPGLRYQQAGEIKTAVQSIVGPTGLPLHAHSVYGREYRSRMHIGGIPLFHYATGIDPVTHRRRIAKGIVAIGDQAIGVLAVGGAAWGGIAIGGMAIGLITLGGFSLGFLLALGGGAFSCGLAFGGFAIAPIAVGGCAVGYYAAGGAGFGIYRFAGNARDPAGEAFFRNAAAVLGATLLIFPGAVIVAMLLRAVVGVAEGFGDGREDAGQPARKPPVKRPADIPVTKLAAISLVLFTLFLMAAVPLGLIAAYFFLSQWDARDAPRTRTAVKRAETTEAPPLLLEAAAVESIPRRQRNVKWTPEGPTLSDELQGRLGLEPDQLAALHQVLQSSYRDYLAVEQNYSQMMSRAMLGRETTIQVSEAEMTALREQLWKRIGELVSRQQLETLQLTLPLVPPRRPGILAGQPIEELVTPGIFGWGTERAEVSAHPEGDAYRVQVRTQNLFQSLTVPREDPQWLRFLPK